MKRNFLLILIGIAAAGALGYLLMLDLAPAELQNTQSSTSTEVFTQEITLPNDEMATLLSLVRINDHPFYTMTYVGSYRSDVSQDTATSTAGGSISEEIESFACSLFVAGDESGAPIFGRNFDWAYHPVLLLFTNPPDAYASVSFVDLSYFVPEDLANTLDTAPLDALVGLPDTPSLPFDGMNEQGLAVGMAAVPTAEMPINPDKETRGSIDVIRDMLDYAATVDEAVQLFGQINVDMEGPHLHYLIADASGNSAIVELADGEIYVFYQEASWQHMTNFRLHDIAPTERAGECLRYAALTNASREAEGHVDVDTAMRLLRDVSQSSETRPAGTLWSVVYEMASREFHVAIKQQFDQVFSFMLP